MEYSHGQRCRLWLYAFTCPAIDRFSRITNLIASPEEIFDYPPDALGKVLGADVLSRMRAHNTEGDIDAMLERLSSRGIDFICRGDDDYPECFEQMSGQIVVPEVLFIRGERQLPSGNAIGVVGTRSCTNEGERIAHDFAREFATSGVTVVSGMAMGIDAAAMQGALDGGGRTVGILGCGVDVPYPAQNQKLVREMLDAGGTLVSEYLPGMQANRAFFPVRNRLIAAICAGTLIVQAPARSGALNTAVHALNCGRDVFVVPGSILDSKYTGSNVLMREGASPALCPRDVLEPLGFIERESEYGKPVRRQAAGLSDDELSIVRLLREREHSFDEIVSQTDFDAARLNSVLTILKIKGIIDETAGKHYCMSGEANF